VRLLGRADDRNLVGAAVAIGDDSAPTKQHAVMSWKVAIAKSLS
jgi:hypothetical protein